PNGTARYAGVSASITLKAKITKLNATTKKARAAGRQTAVTVTLCRSGSARSARINSIEQRGGSRFLAGTQRKRLAAVLGFVVLGDVLLKHFDAVAADNRCEDIAGVIGREYHP